MRENLVRLCLIFLSGTTLAACGPVAVSEEGNSDDNSQEAVEFRKSATGNWQSSCLSFAENGALLSELHKVNVRESSVKVQLTTFSNATCRGTAKSVESFDFSMLVQEAATASHVIMKLTNNKKTNGAVVTQILDTTVLSGSMKTKLIGLSIWENDNEVFLQENELGANREITYTKVN